MRIENFALGVRFDVSEDEVTPEQLWEEVFSVLTTSDIGGMKVYGGRVAASPYAAGSCYICAFTNGTLKEMRRVYAKLAADAGISMYLAASRPFIQSNTLEKMDDLVYYGSVGRDGAITNGDAPFYSLRVCKQRGKRRPAGKGIAFLLAVSAFSAALPAKLAIQRLTIAARRYFRGVRILPFPLVSGGAGTVDAVLTACEGLGRTVRIQGPDGAPMDAYYAVLDGTTAVIEIPAAYTGAGEGTSSFGIGELIRSALNEGLHTVILGGLSGLIHDGGAGCMRALGVKLLDGEGNELSGGSAEGLCKLDLELLHPRISEASFLVMGEESVDGQELPMLRRGDGPVDLKGWRGDGARLVEALLDAENKPGMQALLEAMRFDRRVRNVSLAVAGGCDAQAAEEVLRRCAGLEAPLIHLVTDAARCQERQYGQLTALFLPLTGDMDREAAVARMDEAADRLFRLIRVGRDIERLSI